MDLDKKLENISKNEKDTLSEKLFNILMDPEVDDFIDDMRCCHDECDWKQNE